MHQSASLPTTIYAIACGLGLELDKIFKMKRQLGADETIFNYFQLYFIKSEDVQFAHYDFWLLVFYEVFLDKL